MQTWLTILFFILVVVLFFAGLTLLLLALWDLRQGTNRKSFFIKGFLGVVLLILALWLPSITAAIGAGVSQGLG